MSTLALQLVALLCFSLLAIFLVILGFAAVHHVRWWIAERSLRHRRGWR